MTQISDGMLAELIAAISPDKKYPLDGWFTPREIAAEMQVSLDAARRKLYQGYADKKVGRQRVGSKMYYFVLKDGDHANQDR